MNGPKLPLTDLLSPETKLHQTRRSLQAHHRRPVAVRNKSNGQCIQANGSSQVGNRYPDLSSNEAFAFLNAASIRSSMSAKVLAEGFTTAIQLIQP